MVRASLGDAAPSGPGANSARSELGGLPPMLLQTGTQDGWRRDAEPVHNRAAAGGVDATLSVWADMFHVRHRLAPFLPEATQALAEAGDSISARVTLFVEPPGRSTAES